MTYFRIRRTESSMTSMATTGAPLRLELERHRRQGGNARSRQEEPDNARLAADSILAILSLAVSVAAAARVLTSSKSYLVAQAEGERNAVVAARTLKLNW